MEDALYNRMLSCYRKKTLGPLDPTRDKTHHEFLIRLVIEQSGKQIGGLPTACFANSHQEGEPFPRSTVLYALKTHLYDPMEATLFLIGHR